MTVLKELVKFSKKGMQIYSLPYLKRRALFLNAIENLNFVFYCGIILRLENALRFGWNFLSKVNAELYRKGILSVFVSPLCAELTTAKTFDSILDFGFSAIVIEPAFIKNKNLIKRFQDEEVGIILLCYIDNREFPINTIHDINFVDGIMLENPTKEIVDKYISYKKPIIANINEKETYSIIYKP
jgi:hypothetical protein